jgi:putative ABC transport system permease protein
MLWWTVVKTALKSLVANKLRSVLAALGIVIGVGAVIALLALGAGAQRDVLARVSSLGKNLMVVRPGQHRGQHGVSSGSRETLTLDDAEAILGEVGGIVGIAPLVRRGAQLKYFNRNTSTMVVGTTGTYLEIRNFAVERGRAFSDVETTGSARVVILGPVTAEGLFDRDDPLGEVIKLNGVNFRVVGVLKSKGDQGWSNPDDQAVIPYSTAMNHVFGVDYLGEIDIQTEDAADTAKVQEGISAVLRRRHRIRSDQDDDFEVRDQAEMLETVSSVTRTFTMLLGGIAGISLLVGGIGIMNIMLVTVTERTREIGIRKAIGAKNRDILGQFLLESVLLSGLGGAIGVGFGAGLATLVAQLVDIGVLLRAEDMLLALSFAAGVGVFFGYYPAKRAAKLNPIDALRYE